MDVLSDSRDFEAIVSLFDNKGCAFTRGHCMTNEPVSEMMLLYCLGARAQKQEKMMSEF